MCPTCGNAMICVSTEWPCVFWCPRCGTSCVDGEDAEVPELVASKAFEKLLVAARNAACQCYGFNDGVLKVEYEVITELRKALADYAVAKSQ